MATDDGHEGSVHGNSRDRVPELPNLGRFSVTSGRKSIGSRNSIGSQPIGGPESPNGHAPNLVRESAEVQVLADTNWTSDKDLEAAAEEHARQNISLWQTINLAYRALGVVYGDIGTSPLYVFNNIFLRFEPTEEDVLGATSLILWTITLIVLIKYSLIVLLADDNGEGGTFSLYSIICRYAKIGTPASSFQPSDSTLERYSANSIMRRNITPKQTNVVRDVLQHSKIARVLLLFVVLSGTAMVIGDGVLTPAQSVLSAVGGLVVNVPSLSRGAIVGIACAVLVVLYVFQYFGTNHLGFVFSPIVILWLLFNTIIGIYNIAHWYPGIFRAISPHYSFKFLIDHGHQGWVMLGGVLLCVTGVEAMYADLGHFTRRSIQVGLYTTLLPSLLFTYLGQGAYLVKNPGGKDQIYYNSIPHPVYWPMFVIATLAAIVASQAMITAAFSIIRQSMTLGCFPRMKIIHTNSMIGGQIYIPEINYMLLVLSLAAVGGFQTSNSIGNAYGVAVTFVFFITDILLTLVMLLVWEWPWYLALCYFIFFGALDGVFLSATLNKFTTGGWFPLAIALGVFIISMIWYWGQLIKGKFMRGNMVPLCDLVENKPDSDGAHLKKDSATHADERLGMQEQPITLRRVSTAGTHDVVTRIPGVGLMYADTIFGVPPVFTHLLTNLPAIYQVVVFVTAREVPVPRIDPKERYLITSLDYSGFYRCVCRYGYMETVDLGQEFEDHMVGAIHKLTQPRAEWPGFKDALRHQVARDKVNQAQASKVVYIMGRVDMAADSNANIFKRIFLEYLYNPIERNCRTLTDSWNIPRSRLIEVGMSYKVE